MMQSVDRHGGGGSGGSRYGRLSGKGSRGTSYSGGTGGGSSNTSISYREAGDGEENGGAGGYGRYGRGGGGAGNPGAPGGEDGTGGLLIIYSDLFINNNCITSKGSNASGGASGGGSINIFYNRVMEKGLIEATGGTGEGNGGNGGVKFMDINVNAPTIAVDEITETSVRISITENNTSNIEGVIYSYCLISEDDEIVQETTELQKTIMDMDPDTNYEISVTVNYNGIVLSSNVINIKTLEVYKEIYISSSSGDDITGEGTKDKPYSTLDKISETGIIKKGYKYTIILMEGNYELTEKIFNLDCNRYIDIKGDKEKTILGVKSIYANYSGGKDNYVLNFYRLIWNGTVASPPHNAIYPKVDMSFNNVVFDINFNAASYSYFCSYPEKSWKFNNCVLPKRVTSFLRCDTGTIQLTNCYGGFTSGYGTNNSMWDYQTNYITSNPLVDENYRITDDESLWKNVGTGTNPDGTQANLGVYGGEYSWER